MTIRLDEESGGKLLTVHVSGKLTKADYEQLTPEFERLVGQHGKIRLLFDMTDFCGWKAGAAWEDLKLNLKHHAHIERIAMVGDKEWERVMTIFFKSFPTRASIRYFDHDHAVGVRPWLNKA